jgi:hypothetical protein
MAGRRVPEKESEKNKTKRHAPSMLRSPMISDGDDRAPVDADQIAERLSWTPRQRLRYLLDMLDFEERARRARRIS